MTPLPIWDQSLSDLPIDKQYEYLREVKGYNHEEAVREIMERSGLSGSRIDIAVANVQDRISRQIANVGGTADPRSASGYSKHVIDHLVRMGLKKTDARKRVVWYRGEIVGKWLPTGVSAENAAARLLERRRGSGYTVKDAHNRVVARSKSRAGAHQASRVKKHVGSVVTTTTSRTMVQKRVANRASCSMEKVIHYGVPGARGEPALVPWCDAGYAAMQRGAHVIANPDPSQVECKFCKRSFNKAGQHRRTFAEARSDLLRHLRSQGWQVKSDLKYPHAVSPDGRTHLYFKSQAVYVGTSGAGMGNTSSMWVDIRDVDGPAFMRAVDSWAA